MNPSATPENYTTLTDVTQRPGPRPRPIMTLPGDFSLGSSLISRSRFRKYSSTNSSIG